MRRILAILALLAVATPLHAGEQMSTPDTKPPPPAARLPFIPLTSDAMQSAQEIEEAMGCRIRLSMSRVKATSVPPLEGPGGCGAPDVVRLEGVTLADRTVVAFNPPPMLRCGMAEEVAAWVREDVVRAVKPFGSPLKEIENYNSFECRGRNRVVGTKLSEHGRANALDVRGVKLANGQVHALTDRDVARPFREEMRTAACEHFTTVLGPGSDGYHEEHIHLDLAERRGGYRLCQWDVRDPIQIPLPRARPDFEAAEAKARTADPKADEGGKAEDGKAEDGKSDDSKADEGKTDDGKANDRKADDRKVNDRKAGGRKARDGRK